MTSFKQTIYRDRILYIMVPIMHQYWFSDLYNEAKNALTELGFSNNTVFGVDEHESPYIEK